MAKREVSLLDLGTADYSQVWELQKELVAKRANDEIPDSLLFVEHLHVVTLGRKQSELAKILPAPQHKIPVFEIERGGQATYHGPGQLVGYPILKLEGRERDLHHYLRTLEEVLIRALHSFELFAMRDKNATGVWLKTRPAKKIASIGIAVKHWVTYHGFALNINTDLSYFHYISPCGFDSSVMTSMQNELGKVISVTAVKEAVAASFIQEFNATLISHSQDSVLI